MIDTTGMGLHKRGYRPVANEAPTHYICDCSRERLEQVLLSLGREEIEDMIQKDDGAELTCRFCNKKYRFSGEELTALLREATT